MDLKYYVLWRENNPTVLRYLEKYYQKLQQDIQTLQERWYIKKETKELLACDSKDFLLNGEVSSMINFLFKELIEKRTHPWSIDIFINRLNEEICYFLGKKDKELSMNKGLKIKGTKIRLTTHDYNPYNSHEAHPDHKSSWAILWWWEKEEKEWLSVYSDTFKLLKIIDEGVYKELTQIIHKIIPLGTSKGSHNSASYKECIGHLYMWYTIDTNVPELSNLEALIHESSHNKLNLIMQFDPVILNDSTERYYSPYRPDARHIHGIFLGLHAFVPTIYVLCKAYKDKKLNMSEYRLGKIVLYYVKNKITYKVIQKYGKLTPLWTEILKEIAHVMKLTDIMIHWIDISKKTLIRVKKSQQEHFLSVNMNYPYLQY